MAASKNAGSARKPNVVIFMMDTQGARNMSCYGYRRNTTPNIDRVASQGVLYENHFVTAPWTLPVHASLFTGRYQSGHGAGAQHEGLEPGLPQMGEVFTRAGYRTVSLCNNRWAYDNDNPLSPGCGFQEHIRYNDKSVEPVPPFVPSEHENERDKGSLKAVGLALQWVTTKGLDPDVPFLMFINCTEPHDPYLPPEPFRSQFLAEGVSFEQAVARKGGQALSTTGDRCLTFDDWTVQRSLYDGETACLDDRIGRLVRGLEKRGIFDQTVFIVTGDHGDVLGEQVRYAYHSQNGVWDRVCQTPLIIRYPAHFKAGLRCPELVQINDIFPTMMQICGVEDAQASASIQGRSLLAALQEPTRDFALIESQRAAHVMRRAWAEAVDPEGLDVRFANVWYKAARTKRHKYIWASNGQDMLFDVAADPDERWNIIKSKPDIARRLYAALEQKLMSMELRSYPDMFKPENENRHPPKVIRRLQAWGLYNTGISEPWDQRRQIEWEQKRAGQ